MHAQVTSTDVPTRLRHSLGIEVGVSRVIVFGLGATGLSVARFLGRYGISYAVVDTRESPPSLEELRECDPDAAVFLGEPDETVFGVASHLVVSPGVALDLPVIRGAIAAGARLISDIDLFCSVTSEPVIGITGSNGKSTVTTLLGKMAARSGVQARVGGNLGTPALDLLDEDRESEMYVLELSSFQLERTSILKTSASTLLNISPDHMDRYPELAAYVAAKQRIFDGCDTAVINQDDPTVQAMATPCRRTIRFGIDPGPGVIAHLQHEADRNWVVLDSERLISTDEMLLKGTHNLSNALAALALGTAAGLPREGMADALRVFPGLPHRMQWVEEIDGVTWINDSKATNVGASIAALNGLQGRVILIAGGDGKGADFEPLGEAVQTKARAVVLIGKDADLLESVLGNRVRTESAGDLQNAVRLAEELARPGDTVLLSPACASLDQFVDYQERGRVFESEVRSRVRVY